ncbi:hypothetical protein BN1708_017237 [Verticillium longisporum]|uniref:Uncharacterized protein n=1 Tax=Verticillium longisporum TaxID=100787 RepID=A0A0G4KXN8_VERLO|nr:hypothetical protein BN1708_017237 [Verticillium longisporum]
MSFLAHVPLLGRLVAGADDAPQAIELPPVEVHNVETDAEKRARCLKHLIKANHVNHAIVYHNLQFDNHAAQILCSAYLLGASENQLHSLSSRRTGRTFSATSVGHPLIHLGYAYEMNAKEIAIEALALSCVQYNYLHKYLDEQKYTRPAPFSSTSPVDILDRMASDARFDGLFAAPGFDNIDLLFGKHEDLVLEYWNAWAVAADDASEDPVRPFQQSQEAAVALLVATVKPGTHAYNFFTVHLLTTSHAVRILLPVLPARFHVALVREWWLLAVAVYAAMGRPRIDEDNVQPVPQGRGWAHVEHEALHSRHASDAHYVKAIRAIKEAARTWGDVHERYLAAAVTFVAGFEGWVFD